MERSDLESIAVQIPVELVAARAKRDYLKAEITKLKDHLQNLLDTYGGQDGWASDIETQLAASPTDAGLLTLKANKDKFVPEFQALRTEVNAMDAAVNG